MFWMNALVLCLLIAGHAILWIGFVNRTHGQPWSSSTLKRLRHLHDAMLLIFPVAVVWFVGLHGPRLLLGGSWAELNRMWSAIFLVCTIGWLLCGISILRRVLFRIPSQLLTTESRVYDLEHDLGYRPVARGPYYVMTKVPGNQQFQLELNRKSLMLPRLPRECDGLTILHLTDFHFLGTVTKEFYTRAIEIAAEEPVDLICFTGDLMDRSELVEWLPETLGKLKAPLGCCFILGNHDWYQDQQAIRQSVADIGWIDLGAESHSILVNGATLELAGDETPWIGQHPTFQEDQAFRILLSHTPDNIPWARANDVDLMLSGHNHGGQIKLPLVGPIYSPSRFGCRYADGTFWEPPTFLHVGRGLAGQHPLRINCRPEITRLVLRSLELELSQRSEVVVATGTLCSP